MKIINLLFAFVALLLPVNTIIAQEEEYPRAWASGINDFIFDNFAFNDKEEVVIPKYGTWNGKTYIIDRIPDGAFKGFKNLKKVTFPSTLDYVSEYAFSGCENLETVIFPEDSKCEDIGFYAFEDCKALKTITIPYSMQHICQYAFIGCTNLKEVYINACVPPIIDFSTFDVYDAKLYVPKGCKSYYYRTTQPYYNFFTGPDKEIEESNYRAPGSVLATIPDNANCYFHIDMEDGNIKAEKNDYSNGPFCVPKERKESWAARNEIYCAPKKGYKITRLMVNDVDYTDSLKYNRCRLWTSNEDITIIVETERSVFLTICQSEGGAINFEAENGKSYTYNIQPSDGWKLHSVTFNGEIQNTTTTGNTVIVTTPPITENSTLNIAFEKDEPSTVTYAGHESKLKVSVQGETIIVENAEEGERINVYNESGMIVKEAIGTGNRMEITLPTNNLYVIQTKHKTIKIRN